MRKSFGKKNFLYPMPVLIIGTYDKDGNPNAMNAAWGGITDFDKISIALSSHQTTDNILLNRAFTVSFGVKQYVAACDYVGMVSYKFDKDKFKKAGFTATKSEFVNAPIINELPMTLECEFVSFDNEVMVGRILNCSCDEKYLGEDGKPDIKKIKPITFDPIHNKYIELGKVVADAFSVGKKEIN